MISVSVDSRFYRGFKESPLLLTHSGEPEDGFEQVTPLIRPVDGRVDKKQNKTKLLLEQERA